MTFHFVRSFIMAWRSSGTSNEHLVTNMLNNGLLNSQRIVDVSSLSIPEHRRTITTSLR